MVRKLIRSKSEWGSYRYDEDTDMGCPMCGANDSQMYLGRFGSDAIMRCAFCGAQYRSSYDDDPVVSRSEWGSYRYDGDTDMKVLRKRAEAAVRYFNKGGKPRVDMETNVFGYPFSIIDNGKLVDIENAYKGNVIIRALSYGGGIYEGKVTLSYNDDYNDGRGQGGSGCVLIGDVRDVSIKDGYLVISGIDLGKPIAYRYLIQEKPDEKKVVFPIPKGGKVPPDPPRETPKETPKGKTKPTPQNSESPELTKEWLGSTLEKLVKGVKGAKVGICESDHLYFVSVPDMDLADKPIIRNLVIFAINYPVQGETKVEITQLRDLGDKADDVFYAKTNWNTKKIPATKSAFQDAFNEAIRRYNHAYELYLKHNAEKENPKPKKTEVKPTTQNRANGSMADFCKLLYDISIILDRNGRWYAYPYNGEKNPIYSAAELKKRLNDPKTAYETAGLFMDCYLSHYSEYWNYWTDYGTSYEEWKEVTKRLREIRLNSPKPTPKSTTPAPSSNQGVHEYTNQKLPGFRAEIKFVRDKKHGNHWSALCTYNGISEEFVWIPDMIYSDILKELDKKVDKILAEQKGKISKSSPKPPVKPVPKEKPKAEKPKKIEKPKRVAPAPKPEKPKSAPKPKAEKPKKSVPKKPVTKPAARSVPSSGMAYTVKVNGLVKGTFSSRAKAEALKRDLKKSGFKAQVLVSFT